MSARAPCPGVACSTAALAAAAIFLYWTHVSDRGARDRRARAGRQPTPAPRRKGKAGARAWASPTSAGSTSTIEKHGAEFGTISKQDYLHQAQLLRDAKVGGPILQTVRARRRGDALRPADRRLHRLQSQRRHPHLLQAQRRRALLSPPGGARRMKPPPPPGPPDVADLRELIDQWAEFTARPRAQGLQLRPRQLAERCRRARADPRGAADVQPRGDGRPCAEARPGRQGLHGGTRDFKKCVWGKGTARKEKWTPQKNWWYFRTPLRSNAQLEDELATVR